MNTALDVPVRELMHRPGAMRELAIDAPAPEPIGAGIAIVPKDEPLDVDVRLEGLHDGILASGHVSTHADGECVRCLDPVRLAVEVDFQELFAYSPDEAFDYEVHDDHVGLEPVVRDAVVLALPFQPVCRADCLGLDPVTGEKRTVPQDESARDQPDPRWAALEGFTTED